MCFLIIYLFEIIKRYFTSFEVSTYLIYIKKNRLERQKAKMMEK